MMKMRYIESYELREWVKENLKKAIIHKAHALAVQTGCEILVKLQDETDDIHPGCYYATNHLDFTYNNNGLRRLPGEVSISGETGLPVVCTVEKGIQSQDASKGAQTASTPSVSDAAVGQTETEMVTEEPSEQRTSNANNDEDVQGAVPVSLDSIGLDEDPQSNDSTVNVKHEIGDGIMTIKTEVTDEDTGTLEMTSDSVEGDEMQVGDVLSQSFPSATQSQGFPMVPISPKPYQCSMCHKAFRSIQVLQKHTQTFHMRPQSISMSRGIKGKGGLKQRQSVPFTSTPEQRYQCTMCSRNFRHPALLDDHMNRSHMGFRGSQTFSTIDNTQPSTSALEQLSQSLPLQLGSDNSTMDNPSDSVLPQITSVASLQHLAPDPVHTVASTSSAPFAQGSPMGPVFRHPTPSTSRTPQSRPAGSSNRYTANVLKTVYAPNDLMTRILHCPGPVVSLRCVHQYAHSFRSVTYEEFLQTASSMMDFGKLVAMYINNRKEKRQVFIKNNPDAIPSSSFVEINYSEELYRKRYKCPIPVTALGSKTVDFLIRMGYITQEQATKPTKQDRYTLN